MLRMQHKIQSGIVLRPGHKTFWRANAFSKTVAPGLRLGWIAAPEEVIEAVSHHRDYDTISVGKIDDHFAAMALEHRDRVLARSQAITRENLKILEDWVAGEPLIEWVKPQSGTVTLLRYDLPIGSHDLCVRLVQEVGVLFTPGSAFGMEGYVRIGFASGDSFFSLGEVQLFCGQPAQ